LIEIIKHPPKAEEKPLREPINLYQLQIEGLKEGWLIYPETLNPLVLTIKRKKEKANPLAWIEP